MAEQTSSKRPRTSSVSSDSSTPLLPLAENDANKKLCMDSFETPKMFPMFFKKDSTPRAPKLLSKKDAGSTSTSSQPSVASGIIPRCIAAFQQHPETSQAWLDSVAVHTFLDSLPAREIDLPKDLDALPTEKPLDLPEDVNLWTMDHIRQLPDSATTSWNKLAVRFEAGNGQDRIYGRWIRAWFDRKTGWRVREVARRAAWFFSETGHEDDTDRCYPHHLYSALHKTYAAGFHINEIYLIEGWRAHLQGLQRKINDRQQFAYPKKKSGVHDKDVVWGSRAWISERIRTVTPLGELIYEASEIKRLGYQWSHLCGTSDCVRYSHGVWESQFDNNDRQACHRAAGEPGADLVQLHNICPHSPKCNLRARALVADWDSFKAVLLLGNVIDTAAKRVNTAFLGLRTKAGMN